MLKKASICLVILIVTIVSVSAQITPATEANIPLVNASEIANLQLAVSSSDYPVTQGDVYRLAYRSTAGTVITLDIQIDASGSVGLGVFGKIEGKGLTFFELKQKVEALISKNYAHSLPELTIISPGVFQITVRDGNARVIYAPAWGLTRLSEIVSLYKTSRTSLRFVEMVNLGGTTTRYDLVTPDPLTGNPLDPRVKPGDSVILRDTGKTVLLVGEVRRPGSYELVGQEGLRSLIETFGGGLTGQADPKRVRIDRATGQGGKTSYVSIPEGYITEATLNDGDIVLVRASVEQLSTVWFEGAVFDPSFASQSSTTQAGGLASAAAALGISMPAQSGAVSSPSGQADTNNRFSYRIREGQLLSDVLQDVRSNFLPMADLEHASYFSSLETGMGRHVDIASLLSGADLTTDVSLEPGAKIVIPSVSVSVMVAGAVYAPGAIKYRPNSPAEYYMIQAGGIDPWRNSFRSYDVRDMFGDKKKASEPIQPGDQIFVRENNLFYQLERRVPVLASILALTTSIITLTLVYGQ